MQKTNREHACVFAGSSAEAVISGAPAPVNQSTIYNVQGLVGLQVGRRTMTFCSTLACNLLVLQQRLQISWCVQCTADQQRPFCTILRPADLA